MSATCLALDCGCQIDPFAYRAQPCFECEIVTETWPDGVCGEPYSETMETTGDSGTFVLSSGILPPGLTLDPVTGTISGTPTCDDFFLVDPDGNPVLDTDGNPIPIP